MSDNENPVSGFSGFCPNCGAVVKQSQKFCVSCGSELDSPDPKASAPAAKPSEKKKVGCLQILLWIFFFPIMLTIQAIKRKKLGWIIASVVVWLLAIALFISYSSFVNSPEYILSSTRTAEFLAPSKTAQVKTKNATQIETVATAEISAPAENTVTVFQQNTPPALISIETMPGIESWASDVFFDAFSKLTGYAIPEARPGEEGLIRGEMNADNGSCRTDYHVTENDAGKVAEAFFNFDTGCPRDWLAEIAALTAVGTDYQKELVGFIKSFDGKKAIENIYGDGWYKVDTGGNGETFQLIIQHFQYDEYLAASSGL